MAFHLVLQDLEALDEGKSDASGTDGGADNADDVCSISGTDYALPYDCVACMASATTTGKAATAMNRKTKESLEAHFSSKEHALACRALVSKQELALTDIEIKAIKDSVLYTKPLPPVDTLSRIRKKIADSYGESTKGTPISASGQNKAASSSSMHSGRSPGAASSIAVAPA